MNGAVSQDKIQSVLDAAVAIIWRTLAEGEPVKFAGFGSLVPKECRPRRFYSPAQKDFIVTRPKTKILFEPE